ncbi:rrp4-like rna-binding protein [Tubulinosema ratisbonensis]|uniref:Rrp4-like rna-binding protein n=1 Tax=Tubulinosema ratisbonensis TaxID=291195 RepID=A0A437AMR0_9MICR|nr:rrp4-like rna-binding protein [Tubulinosema ratisbonensis]
MNQRYLPGEKICEEEDFVRGHGTNKKGKFITATVFGTPILINKLLSVHPTYNLRYTPETGDVVVGRVIEIGNKKWRVDINSKTEVSLSLTSITLPGTVQRRKIEEDEMNMREYFDINDLLVAEIQKVNKSFSAALHTRNEKYKKLTNGITITLPVMIVPRMKSPFLENENLEIILGMNGIIFLGIKKEEKENYQKISFIFDYLTKCKEKLEMVDYEYLINLI